MKILEYNVTKKNWRSKQIKFVLCYPNKYRVGLSCLAIHLLYEILNANNDILCERAFYDPNLPILSIESKKSLNSFDIIGFSLQYELDYVNLVKMLLASNISPLVNERGERGPIICLGGPAITANPEPLAHFADVIFVGEIEEVIDQFISVLLEYQGKKKTEVLDALSKITGVYIPSFNNKVKRAWVNELDKAYHSVRQIIPLVSSKSYFYPVLGRSFLLEISRGCALGCRFCLEGYNYLPMRFRSIENILKIINQGLKYTGVNNFIIIGSAAFLHPNIKDLLKYLRDEKCSFSMPSLRLDFVDEDLLMLLKSGGQRTPVFAPESTSDRLLNLISKRIKIEDLFEAVRMVKNVGFKNIKLYFMLGLPGETIDDVKSIISATRKIADYGFLSPKSIRLSFSFFVPKANTPLQWVRMEDPDSLKCKIKLIREELCSDKRFDVRLPNIRESMIQAFISRSGRDIAQVLIHVAKTGGRLLSWRNAEKVFNFSLKNYVTSHINLDSKLPWEHIDIGYSRSILLSEYRKASIHM
ncbi:MAG: radical SAM protein [Candidatus Methanomethylicia archaeon]|nr:radical SAM protein [Candidatus Methanomethylicia archaeon]MCX8169050.1 radical SAM protein [Candidatus Methanomethylicia archaeon]MDW7988782.1 radical SAM protein [Nitrososphaerota archaeon]